MASPPRSATEQQVSMSHSRMPHKDAEVTAVHLSHGPLEERGLPQQIALAEPSHDESQSSTRTFYSRDSTSTSLSPSTRQPASSNTLEKLRQIEKERDDLRQEIFKERAKASKMRRIAEEEKAIAERLKREGTVTRTSSTDAKRRMLDLERGTKFARGEKRNSTSGAFKDACSTDLLFLIDTTRSMTKYIDAAKNQVLEIIDDIKEAFLHEADVRIAVVSYTDHGFHEHIETLDFTAWPEDVHSFISALEISTGGDIAEDVLGGIEASLNLSWSQQTRCIIHIADAPPHGNVLHDGVGDDHPIPGSEPHRLTHEPLLQQMVSMNINYAFLRIKSLTDRMVYEFLKPYAAASAEWSLHTSNVYFTNACRTLEPNSRLSQDTIRAGLCFAELELGTTYSALQRLVVNTVTSAASRTANRLSVARTGRASSNLNTKAKLLSLEEEPREEVQLDTSPPQWSTSGWLDERLVVEGFLLTTVAHDAQTLNGMMDSDDNITMSVSELTISKRSQPFAQGSLRTAYYARTAASTNLFVVKAFKRGGKQILHLVEDMRCQALCRSFALEFNALAEEDQNLDFIATTCFKGKSAWERASSDECLSLEPFLPGHYVKYNNNTGWVNNDLVNDKLNQMAQAFSHFTFERSSGRFLVCDLQGVGGILTDPSIHTSDPERFKLVDTNMNSEGFKFFFSTHICNDICTKLELKSNKSMLMLGGELDFRTDWPLSTTTTCCYNRLCGRIIRLRTARKLDAFPGYFWCTNCWYQLRSSKGRWLCVVGNGDHEFDVSTFFYESQGRRPPRQCPDHIEETEGITTRSKVYLIKRDGALSHASPILPKSTIAETSAKASQDSCKVKEQEQQSLSSTTVTTAEPAPPPYSAAPPETPSDTVTLALLDGANESTNESTITLGSQAPPEIGTEATPRNIYKLWAKLKSATRMKKSSQASLLP